MRGEDPNDIRGNGHRGERLEVKSEKYDVEKRNTNIDLDAVVGCANDSSG